MWRLLFGALASLLLTGCYNFTHEKISGTEPVAEIELTRLNGAIYEVRVEVQAGVRIDSLVDVSYFDGLTHRMSLDDAKQRFGEPRRVRTQPDMRLPVSLYPVAKAEVGFMSVPTSGGAPRQPQVWAYPTNQSPAEIILNGSLRAQILRHLSSDRPARVHIRREDDRGPLR